MFKHTIILRSVDDVKYHLLRIDELITQAQLQAQADIFLREQLNATLTQFEQQMSLGPEHKVSAYRLLEGNGYKIVVRINTGRNCFLGKLKRMIGLA